MVRGTRPQQGRDDGEIPKKIKRKRACASAHSHLYYDGNANYPEE